jgi:membrane-associated phospholipid phosphatase
MHTKENRAVDLWKVVLLIMIIGGLMVYVKSSSQIDFILALQASANKGEITFLQFMSDSITFFSLGIPLLIGIIGEFGTDKKKSRQAFLYVALSIALAGLISFTIKNIAAMPRPFQVDARVMKWSSGGSFSFPSGHTTEAFASAAALSILYPYWKVIVPVFIWACLIGLSRMLLGVHFPFDVLGGMALGITTSYFLHLVFKRRTIVFS